MKRSLMLAAGLYFCGLTACFAQTALPMLLAASRSAIAAQERVQAEAVRIFTLQKQAIGSNLTRAQAVQLRLTTNQVMPVGLARVRYPRGARDRGEEGRVLLKMVIDQHGQVATVRVVESSGHAELDIEAQRAIWRSAYQPYLENGKAISVAAQQHIIFKLKPVEPDAPAVAPEADKRSAGD